MLQTNVSSPGGRGDLHVSLLRQQQRKVKSFPKKQELKFPKPPTADELGKSYRRQDSGKWQATDTFENRVYAFLCRRGMQLLYATPLAREGLSEDLEALVWAEPHTVDFSAYEGQPRDKGRFTPEQVERMARRAASFCLDTFDPEKKKRLSEAGAKGGRTSRRGPRWTVENLEGLEEFTAQEAADRLGCSKRTVDALRAKQRDLLQSKPQDLNDLSTTAMLQSKPSPIMEDVADAVYDKRRPWSELVEMNAGLAFMREDDREELFAGTLDDVAALL